MNHQLIELITYYKEHVRGHQPIEGHLLTDKKNQTTQHIQLPKKFQQFYSRYATLETKAYTVLTPEEALFVATCQLYGFDIAIIDNKTSPTVYDFYGSKKYNFNKKDKSYTVKGDFSKAKEILDSLDFYSLKPATQSAFKLLFSECESMKKLMVLCDDKNTTDEQIGNLVFKLVTKGNDISNTALNNIAVKIKSNQYRHCKSTISDRLYELPNNNNTLQLLNNVMNKQGALGRLLWVERDNSQSTPDRLNPTHQVGRINLKCCLLKIQKAKKNHSLLSAVDAFKTVQTLLAKGADINQATVKSRDGKKVRTFLNYCMDLLVSINDMQSISTNDIALFNDTATWLMNHIRGPKKFGLSSDRSVIKYQRCNLVVSSRSAQGSQSFQSLLNDFRHKITCLTSSSLKVDGAFSEMQIKINRYGDEINYLSGRANTVSQEKAVNSMPSTVLKPISK